jgi:DNA gyrase/topoisomerase IV subunit B
MNLHKYVKLDEIQRVLQRPGMYVGSTSLTEQETYWIDENGKVQFGTLKFVPAFLKLFDEVIQNSYDHSKRPEGAHLNKIEVTLDRTTGEITIYDNGGIPVEKHPVYDEYIPDFIFGEMGTGSNYNDDEAREGAGTNGLGAKLTNIYAKRFTVETADGKNKYIKTYENNRADESDAVIRSNQHSYTIIKWLPDYARLGMTGLDDDHFKLLVKRVYEIAAASTKIKVKLNGELLDVRGWKSYIEKFTDNFVYFENDNWQIGFAKSEDGFKHVSLVNACSTWMGGSHLDYIVYQVIPFIRQLILKKTKQDIRPSMIKEQFKLFVNCTIHNPQFSSQTKENLTTEPRNYGTEARLDAKTLNKILTSIGQEILDWAVRRQLAQEEWEKKQKNKNLAKADLKKIEKYEPALERTDRKNCILFVCEGDSAAGTLTAARVPQWHGTFPLRGKPMNVMDAKRLADIRNNEEITNLMKIIGLQHGVTDPKIEDLRYGKMVIASDADMDGYHIRGLLMTMFQTLWPGLIKQGFLQFLNTPIVRAIKGKDKLEFFSEKDYEDWCKQNDSSKFQVKYIKGLGGHKTEDFKKYMNEKKFQIPIDWVSTNDYEAVKLAFDKGKADERKVWLYGEQSES